MSTSATQPHGALSALVFDWNAVPATSRILLRAGKGPGVPVSPEATLAQNVIGNNAGNLLFAHAVHRHLSVPGTEVVADSYQIERAARPQRVVGRINREYDHLVIPLANAFRKSFVPLLNRLTATIEQLEIPVTVVGVGSQHSMRGPGEMDSDVANAHKRFVTAVLNRSAKIGVRGELTRSYLKSIGFGDEHVDVIGCPSLFTYDEPLRIEKGASNFSRETKISVNMTPYVKKIGEVVQSNLDRYPEMMAVLQTSPALSLLLWGDDGSAPSNPLMPEYTGHPLYRSGRLRMFVDPRTWVEFLRGREFSFGTRIHGNIAALLAGTPAVVLAHDSRTLELVEYHGIPHRRVDTVPNDLDPAQLFDEADFSEFNQRQPETLAAYRRFLDANGLVGNHLPGKANPAYDERLATVALPGPVKPLSGEIPLGEQLLSRLNWLRQGPEADKARKEQRYVAPFAAAPAKPKLSETDALVKRLQAAQAEIDSLSAQLDELKRRRAGHGFGAGRLIRQLRRLRGSW